MFAMLELSGAVRALRIGFPPRDTRSKFPSCCRRVSTVAIRQRVVSSVRDERTQMPADRPVAMVPHSNAGLLIPAIGSGAYVIRCLRG